MSLVNGSQKQGYTIIRDNEGFCEKALDDSIRYERLETIGKIMLIQDVYLVMFKMLSDYYLNINKSESLGSLLGDMDPHLFSDGKPADPATYNDWYDIVVKYTEKGEIENKNIVFALQDFLSNYQQRFGFNLEEVIAYFKEMSKSPAMIE